MSPNTMTTQREVQALWAALKWVVFVGLSLAFGLGAWATNLRADVNRSLEGVSTSTRVEKQLDSLRIETRHIGETQQEIKLILLNRK